MKQIIYIIIIVLFSNTSCWCQIINFTDMELKQFLINELCVDTTDNGISFSNDLDVDLNNDNEIQISEALSVQFLELDDFADGYSIKSLQDINSFSNLKYLKILSLDSVVEISNLNLDSLKTLWIGSSVSLKSVDISSLHGLSKDLRIEDIDTLDYLNLQNGSVPNYFSLFYSEHIHYACVDNIASEYDEVAWRMISGTPTINNCSTLTANISIHHNQGIKIFPNPTRENVTITASFLFDNIQLYSLNGDLVKQWSSIDNTIDVKTVTPGVYFLFLESSKNNKHAFKRLIKF